MLRFRVRPVVVVVAAQADVVVLAALEALVALVALVVLADPEALVDKADHDDLQNLQEKYGRDSSIPTDERRKFTLRRQEKLPDGDDEKGGT